MFSLWLLLLLWLTVQFWVLSANFVQWVPQWQSNDRKIGSKGKQKLDFIFVWWREKKVKLLHRDFLVAITTTRASIETCFLLLHKMLVFFYYVGPQTNRTIQSKRLLRFKLFSFLFFMLSNNISNETITKRQYNFEFDFDFNFDSFLFISISQLYSILAWILCVHRTNRGILPVVVWWLLCNLIFYNSLAFDWKINR